jgi:membrane fusion protein, adhesin transport system
MPKLINKDYKSVTLVDKHRFYLNLIKIFLVILFLFIASLFFPWRQTVTGVGKVTIFSPMYRPQNINTMIDSRIKEWKVQEGDIVTKGQHLLELEEVNQNFLDQNLLARTVGQRDALSDKKASMERMIASLKEQIDSLKKFQSAAVPNAELRIDQSTDKLITVKQKYLGADQNFKTAELNYERRKQLYEKGLASKRDLELSELDFIKTQADLLAVKAELDIAERDIRMSRLDFSQVDAQTALKIQETEAKLADAFQKLADIESSIFKADVDISNLESRIFQRNIYSPVDGQIISIYAPGSAEIIKSGTLLATVVPESIDQAVELYISDFFVPLVSAGRKVRLQFSGFPALQFSGWPMVAIGTFAGEVAVVDAVASSNNMYRILIRPDYERIEAGKDAPWPTGQHLRAGTNATGWIILDEVPLWFELWRIFNGFPPSLMTNPERMVTRKHK